MKCKCQDAPCPREAEMDGYCKYCYVMFPCDHAEMDKKNRIVSENEDPQ